MKLIGTILLLLFSLNAIGQTAYTIENFSSDYYGKAVIDEGQQNEVFKKGYVAVYDRKSGREVIKITSDELTFELNQQGDVTTNVVELPYGEQSLLIHEDFNFDGHNDLAIMDGQFSCYHGPSYQVYLFNPVARRFEHNQDFTQLAQEYCGMFEVDTEKRQIHTMTKSGCCWHQFSSFTVENSQLKPLSVTEENAMNFPYLETISIVYTQEGEQKSSEKSVDLEQEGVVVIASYTLLKSGKQVVLFSFNDQTLNYVLLNKEGMVEFNYPPEAGYQQPDFKVNAAGDRVGFQNKDATYQLYQTQKAGKTTAIGIHVTVKGKSYDLKGDVSTLKGSLKDIHTLALQNVLTE